MNKMKLINVFFLKMLLGLNSIVLAQHIDSFSIQGHLVGLKDEDTLYLSRRLGVTTQSQIESFVINTKDEGFSIKIPFSDGPIFYQLKNKDGDKRMRLFLDNSNIKISGLFEELANAPVEGSKSHLDYNGYKSLMHPFENDKRKFSEYIQNTKNQQKNLILKYIRNHKNSWYVPVILFDNDYGVELTKTIFNELHPNLKTSFYGKLIQNAISKEAYIYDKKSIVGDFTISGHLEGLKSGDTLYVRWLKDVGISEELDSVMCIANSGKFLFTLPKRVGPNFYRIISPDPAIKQSLLLFLDSSQVQIKGKLQELESAFINGSRSHVDYENYKKFEIENLSPLRKHESEIYGKIDYVDSLLKENDRVYVMNHPHSQYSSVVLLLRMYDADVSYTQSQYNKLSEEVKNGLYGREVKKRLDDLASIRVGEEIADYMATTLDGKKLSINDVIGKGEVTLVDFWASWCKPCRKENPKLVSLFRDFHSKGLNILGISLDHDYNNWKSAIEADNLSWYQISELKGWNSTAAAQFRLTKSGIPQNILLDKEGKIIAVGLSTLELSHKLSDLLGK